MEAAHEGCAAMARVRLVRSQAKRTLFAESSPGHGLGAALEFFTTYSSSMLEKEAAYRGYGGGGGVDHCHRPHSRWSAGCREDLERHSFCYSLLSGADKEALVQLQVYEILNVPPNKKSLPSYTFSVLYLWCKDTPTYCNLCW